MIFWSALGGCFIAAAAASSGWASLQVEARDGAPMVRVPAANVAVFQPEDNEVWVVTEAGGGAISLPPPGGLSAAWQVELLQVGGGQGIKIVGAAPRRWGVTGKPGDWQVTLNAPPAPVAKGVNAVVLRDRVMSSGPAVLAISRDGRRYPVVLAPGRVGRQPGVAAGLLGKAADAALAESNLAKIEPAAGPMTAVPVKRAEALRGIGSPKADAEELAPIHLKVYRPGTVLPYSGAAADGKPAALGPQDKDGRALAAARSAGAVAAAQEEVEAAVNSSGTLALDENQVQARLDEVRQTEENQEAAEIPAEDAAEPEVGGIVPNALPFAWPVALTRDYEKKEQALSQALQAALRACPALAGSPSDDSQGPLLAWTYEDYKACLARPEVVAARLPLAALALGANRAPEALAQLAQLPQSGGYPAAPEGRFLHVVAEVVKGDRAAALKLIERKDWPPAWRGHLAMWHAAALQADGRSGKALDVWPRQGGLLPQYPAPLRLLLQRRIAEAQVAVGDRSAARQFVDELAGSYEREPVPAWLNRLRGLVRLGGAQEAEGLDMLAAAANQNQDPETSAWAKYDFVQTLLRRGELSRTQVMAYLDELRLFWRGDDLEKKVLAQLADLRLAEGNYRSGLDALQMLVKVDPANPGMEAITDKMTAGLLAAFDPENGVKYSPLTFVGMYYDFKELVPANAEGDRVTERVADLLSELGLPRRALPLYEQLLKFRMEQPLDRGRVSLKLAEAYRDSGNAAAALQTADKYMPALVNSAQREAFHIMGAKALVDLRRYDSAKRMLGNLQTPEARIVRGEIAWRQRDWAGVRAALAPLLGTPDATGIPLELMRVAYADGARGNLESLADIIKSVGGNAPVSGTSADILAAIAGEAGVTSTVPTGTQPLGRVAEALHRLNVLTDNAKSIRRKQLEEIEKRHEYDDKMRYMELLPPPVL